MKRDLYKLSRTGHLRRLASRDAADQTRQIKAFIRRVIPEPCHLKVERGTAMPSAETLAELGCVLAGDDQPILYTGFDVSRTKLPETKLGLYCMRHERTNPGNFCELCEQESADTRVPVRKPTSSPLPPLPPVQADSQQEAAEGAEQKLSASLGQDGVQGHTGTIRRDEFFGHTDRCPDQLAIRVHRAFADHLVRPATDGGEGGTP